MAEKNCYDIAVVGGGLHSVSMAREAAGRGLDTILIQDGDIADGGSSIPLSVAGGDLRKLEAFDLAKVSSNFEELSRLKNENPHLVKPISISIAHDGHIRSPNRINAGLMLYKRMQPSTLALGARMETGSSHPKIEPSIRLSQYNDTLLQNSRTIIDIAQQAQNMGAKIKPRHRVTSSERKEKAWLLNVLNQSTQESFSVKTKIVVNCCGWLANDFVKTLGATTRAKASYVESGHIYIRVNTPWTSGVMFQKESGCLVYAYPFNTDTVCLGPIILPANSEHIRDKTINSIINQWNNILVEKIDTENIIHQYWCHKARIEDPTYNNLSATQDSLLDLNNPGSLAPALNLFGVDVIQHRKIAVQALDILAAFTGKERTSIKTQRNNTSTTSPNDSLFSRYSFIEEELLQRLVSQYGPKAEALLNDIKVVSDRGRHFGHGLYEFEVQYLIQDEWATSSNDILWRRTYLGTKFTDTETKNLDEWLKTNTPLPNRISKHTLD